MTLPTDRFAFTTTQRDMMNFAVYSCIVDAVDLAIAMCTHGTDFDAIMADVDRAAEALMHTNATARSKWIAMRDAVRWFAYRQENSGSPDKFGFAADARAKATSVLAQSRVRID